MGFCGWVSSEMCQKGHFLWSTRLPLFFGRPVDEFPFRERRQFHVFEELLLLVPGLQDRFKTGDEEDIAYVAEMVHFLPSIYEYT